MSEEGPEASPFFTRHARAYADSPSQARGADLGLLLELVEPVQSLRVLDVATGTGHTALALAERGALVTGVDPTPAMLAEARRLAAARELSDRVSFVEGVAESLPTPDASWDLVTCRRAAHHFRDLPRALREMFRCLVPGGRLAIADLTPPEEASGAFNLLEATRDGTHVRALTAAEWQAALVEAGFRPLVSRGMVEDVPFPEWLSPVRADAAEGHAVQRAWDALGDAERAALAGGRTGRWLKRRLVLLADRAGSAGA